MNFNIGDTVICVNNKFLETDRDLLQYPKVNNTYTVRGVYPDGEAIYLVGIQNLNVPGTNEEPCFLNWRFIKTQELSKEYIEEFDGTDEENQIAFSKVMNRGDDTIN